MEGDICPLKEMVEASKEVFPSGNVQFMIDESHSSGHIGPNGAGLVCELGLKKEIAIRNHSLGKTLAGIGGVILGNSTVRNMLLNFARQIHFTIAPSFPMACTARAGYAILRDGRTAEAQQKIQHVVKLFMDTITENPIWDAANDAGIIRIPLYEEDDWNELPFVTQICPVWTRPKHNVYLALHLQMAGYAVFPISYPIVPRGDDRVRVILHAHNTDEQVKGLVEAICAWDREMLEIQRSGDGSQLPVAARQAYQLMGKDSVNGSS